MKTKKDTRLYDAYYQFALALEKDHISGEDTEISCICNHTLIKCVLNNTATIYWDRSE